MLRRGRKIRQICKQMKYLQMIIENLQIAPDAEAHHPRLTLQPYIVLMARPEDIDK